MIKIDNLSFKYDNSIFEDITLNIPKNKITLIIGPNGSGKSTLALLLSGLLFTHNSTITIDDLIINKKTKNKLIREKIGIVFQNPHNQIIFNDVYENIKFTLENNQITPSLIDKTIKNTLQKVNMLKHIHSNPYNLSGGQKQHLAIASAISTHPEYLIFDKATSMLDNQSKDAIYQLIIHLKKEMGIIFITNNINEIIYADYIIIIDNKKTYTYTLPEITTHPSILSNHHISIPFILKIAQSLNITNHHHFTEKYILERLKHHD